MQDSNKKIRQLYPIELSLEDSSCLIVGFGAVGRRKLAGLLPCSPAAILVLDLLPFSAIPPETAQLFARHNISYAQRLCLEEDILDKTLVFACTSDPGENMRISRICKRHSILCNLANMPDKGSFQLPAVVRQDGVILTVSTGGASPALACSWRDELSSWLDQRVGMAVFMGRLRQLVFKLQQSSAQNKKLFHQVVDGPLSSLLRNGDKELCQQYLRSLLPGNLHGYIAELLDDLP